MAAVVAVGVFAALVLVAVGGVPASAAESESCAGEAVDVAAAVRLAAVCGRSVEALSERTERTQVFVQGDGTARLVSAAVPQRVRRADGSWANIDKTLYRGAGGYRPAATLADVRFSAGGDDPLVTWVEGGSTFTLGWPWALPVPVVEGDTARYSDVIDGVDLLLSATVEGFRHVLEVKTAEAAANQALREISYTLGGDLVAQTDSDGTVRLVDGSGETVIWTAGATMWDSSLDVQVAGEQQAGVMSLAQGGGGEQLADLRSSSDGPGAGSVSAAVDVAVTGGELTLTPDARMLTDSHVTFPLFIDPPFNKQRSKWAYANSINSNWEVGNRAWVGRNPYDGTLYRSYFSFSTSAMTNTTVLSAEITMVLDHSWSCGDTWVHLYRTNGTWGEASGSRISWSNEPLGSVATHLDGWAGHANEAGGCGTIQPDADVVFEGTTITNDVKARMAAGATSYWVGLCACNSSDQYESTQDRWKKFYTDKTYLIATYNVPPDTPTVKAFSTTSECYAACTSPAVVRTTRPTLKVGVSHEFDDQLRTTFEVRTAASGSATLVATNASAPTTTASPATASWQVPSGELANGSTYYWRARSRNLNDQYGSWTGWQTLTVDTSAPSSSVSSTQYPYRQWGAVVGTAGTFTLTGDASVHDFTWQVDSGSATTVNASGTSTKTANVSYTPPVDMVHTMQVKARDIAGNVGATVNHQFWVSPAANRCWHWKLDESSGATAADTGNTSSSDPVCGPIGATVTPMNGTLSGSVGFGSGYLANAAVFTGSGGQVATAGPVLDTSRSFTVTAWVDAADLAAGDQSVISQDGTSVSRFQLGYVAGANSGAGGWCMSMRGSDSTSAATAQACGAGDVAGPPVEETWVHLAGVYDATTAQLSVYVMGGVESCPSGETATVASVGSWQASGAFVIGRARSGGAGVGYWRGGVDAVHAYNRALSAGEICTLALQ